MGQLLLSLRHLQAAAMRSTSAMVKTPAAPPPRSSTAIPRPPEMQRWRRAHGLGDDATVAFIDPPPAPPSPNAAALARVERERAERQRLEENTAAELRRTAVDGRTSSKARQVQRLEQLGVDDPELLGAVREPTPSQPKPDPGGAQRDRLEAARRELATAELVAGRTAGSSLAMPIDVGGLSLLAAALYYQRRRWDPNVPEITASTARDE